MEFEPKNTNTYPNSSVIQTRMNFEFKDFDENQLKKV